MQKTRINNGANDRNKKGQIDCRGERENIYFKLVSLSLSFSFSLSL
jgi:hypothetical protein